MANKDNKNNTGKKSNVIYIDRNKNNKIKNNSNNKNKSNLNDKKTKNKSIDDKKTKVKTINTKSKNDNLAKKNSSKSSTNSSNGNVSNIKNTNTKKSNDTNKKHKRKIKWGRVCIAVVIVLVLGFGGFKGVQMMKNKSQNQTISSASNVNANNSEDVKQPNSKKHSSKGQYDLDDEKKQRSKKYNIVVDAGHGGNDKGSLDSTETIYEKDIALQIAKKVASRLGRESDVNVIMTRTEDKYVSLSERAEIAKRANADALVSIHLNAQKKFGDANGLETWYRGGATDGSKELANSVQKTTASYVEINNRGILQNNFEILRETTMPAVLVECGFITNTSDMKKLKEPNYQDMLAEGIMQGTLSFLDSKNGKN